MSAAPFPLPETEPFWNAVEEERLLIQRCADCGRHYFPPAPVCPHCTSRNVDWTPASGRARLYSFVIVPENWREWGRDGPTSVALVELEEGPRMVSTVVDCPQTPEALALDMPLDVAFRAFAERKMVCFAPAEREAQS